MTFSPNASFTPIFPPVFHAEIMASHNLHDDEHVKLTTSQNWLTESLKCEINNYSPINDDIIIDKATREYCYKPEIFERACETVFAKGREFLNWLQFKQYGYLFLSTWNVKGKHETGKMLCSFNKSKPKKSSVPPKLHKSIMTLMKYGIDCKFRMLYIRIGYYKPYQKMIYYRIYITTTNFEHAHPLSNVLK